jgi:hypothetical protein
MRRVSSGAIVVALLVGASPTPASAQTRPPGPGRGIQIAVTGAMSMPAGFDPVSVAFTTPAGEPLVISRVEPRVGVGFGVDLHLGMRAGASVDLEATGSWLRLPYRTAVTLDLEDAQPLTASATSSQFGVEGAAVWTIARRGRTEVFLRGAGGWVFETSDRVLIDTGWAAHAGAGVKYWWRDRTPPSRRRMGLRIEGRLRVHDTGVIATGRVIRLTPVAVGGVIFGL